jgi:IS30 family transposase
VGNVLKMEKQQQIKALLNLGWSYRAIENATGVRRETISKYDHRKSTDSKPAKVPIGDSSTAANCPPANRSSARFYDSQIKEGISAGLSAQRIYQDLVIDIQADVSYDAVKRYVRKLKKKEPTVYARMHRPPGEEAQVDFGQGAPTLKNGKYRKPWLFKMVLSCSHTNKLIFKKEK